MTNIIAVNPIDCNALDPSSSMPGQGLHSFVAPSLAAAIIAHHRGMVSSCRHYIVAKRNDRETLRSQRARRDEEFACWFPFMSTHYWLPAGCRMSPNLAAYFSASLINRQQPCSFRNINNSQTSHDATMTNQRPRRQGRAVIRYTATTYVACGPPLNILWCYGKLWNNC
ncbi:hypothetical protein CGCF413_v015606 [Colletotrichum fructicola]|nr:hypothetical protein CGCF413_v015606 [Colletotrichum fructicola]